MRAEVAKFVMLIGAILFAIGFFILIAPKVPLIGKLPGDIDYKGRSFRVYFPIMTCIILSIILTIVLNLLNVFKK